MNKKAAIFVLQRLYTIIFGVLLSISTYSQTKNEDIQKLYDKSEVSAYVSGDYGESVYSILTYTSNYGFSKVFDAKEINQVYLTNKQLSHSKEIPDRFPYFEDIYLLHEKHKKILNLNYRRKNDYNNPYFRQLFLVYKIELPIAANLKITNEGSRVAPEMYIGLAHNPSYNGSMQNKIHIFESTVEYEGDIDMGFVYPTGYKPLDVNLPAGEYYLLVSSAAGGSQSSYPRGLVNTQILVGTYQKEQITAQIYFEYDASGNRISRVIPISNRTLMTYEEPEEIIEEQVAKRDVKIYSSIKDQITVELSSLDGIKNGTIQIMSFPLGNQITTRRIQNSHENIDLSSQPSGIYILTIDIDGEKTSHKLMK